jgi:hypothetical protein
MVKFKHSICVKGKRVLMVTHQNSSVGRNCEIQMHNINFTYILAYLLPSFKTLSPKNIRGCHGRITGFPFILLNNIGGILMQRGKRKSKMLIQDPLFVRGEYNGDCLWDIPLIRACAIDDQNIQFVSFQSTRSMDVKSLTKKGDIENLSKAVHFFVDDKKFEKVYNHPDRYTIWLAKYKYVLTPDFSLFMDMPLWMQINNVARSRWCGRRWQDAGLNVIPSISWSKPESYSFAFLGLEKGTTVAVSTIGAKHASKKNIFLQGYDEMLNRVAPGVVYCYGKPFAEMKGNLIHVDYLATTRRAD